jgi:hypothetical protein
MDSTFIPAAAEAEGERFRFASSLFRRRRPLFWLSLSYCAGIVIDAFAAPSLRTLGGLTVAVFLAASALLFVRRGGLRASRGLACGLALSLCCGMLLHALQARIPPANDIARRTPALPSLVYLRGTIIEASQSPRGGSSWTVAVEAIGADTQSLSPAGGRVRLRVNAPETRDDDERGASGGVTP